LTQQLHFNLLKVIMMKKAFISFFVLSTIILASSFHTLRTDIRINVRNELGNIESDVKVSLYKTKDNYEKSTDPKFTGVTDVKGNVTFDGVEAIEYYIGAEKGDRNNFGAGEKTTLLQENKLNKFTIIISE
jgi:hypothetical protein